ncbi:outer membrane beta-barrel protein [Mucilaginibacter sp.]|uniref:outer membrane beta-barrel protein n=1 Tax=Mucilaginibacter sp. TaxID=1882438 RepID=UPI00260E69DD|nr:outer membrane beta-barrel protein [Mucilaginibacter sp.]
MKKIVLIVLCCCLYFMSSAQTRKTITVRGILIDSTTNTPLGYVTVSLMNPATKLAVKSGLAKDDGTFEFEGVASKAYKLILSSLGYKTKTVNVVAGKDAIIDVGKIIMSPSANGLNEVTITADKPLIKQEVDRISYDIQADPESKVLNVLDMLRKVPLLSLDADDNILLKGGGDYKILINGKPSSLVARSPKDIFRAMPASSIQRIEVITTPPAKYDSEGLAGIINIITTKKIDNGYNGSLNISHRFPVGGPGAGGSFTFKQGKFGASAFYGANYNKQPQTTNSSSRIATDTTSLNQSGTRYSTNKSGYIGTEFSYEIDTLNLLTAEFNINGGNSTSQSNQASVKTKIDTIMQGYNIANAGIGKYNGFDVGFNYQLGFKNRKDQLLTFSYKYTVSNNTQFNDLGISNRVYYPVLGHPDYQQNNKEQSKEQNIQLDYAQTVKVLNVEAGFKGIIRNGTSDFEYDSLRYDPLNAMPTHYDLDPARTNAYDNNRYILGVYNSYQYNLENWGFKVGGRVEETIVNANFITSSQQVNQNYFNFIPSISINRKFGNMSSLNFGFTQRIQRPGITNLNPFVDRSNPNFEYAGNPNLKTVVSNNYQMNYSRFKKGSINIGLSYSVASNTVQQISTYDKATGITRSTFDNVGKNQSLGSNFNVNYPITRLWNFNLNGNLNYLWLEGTVNGALTKNSGLQGFFNASTGYKLGKGYRVNANFNFNSPFISLQGKSNAYLYTAYSGSKEIIKNKVTLSASVSNPFSKYRTNIRNTNGIDFVQSNYTQSYLRVYAISLHYRFGKLKDAIRRNQRTINSDDISKPLVQPPPQNNPPQNPAANPPPSITTPPPATPPVAPPVQTPPN